MLLFELSLLSLVLMGNADQTVFKSDSTTNENFMKIPDDPSDPSAWDFDWSFSGIRFDVFSAFTNIVRLHICLISNVLLTPRNHLTLLF
jgi:hypothetical protein